MNINVLLKPFAIYMGLLGPVTVDMVYLAVHSGLYTLGLTGVGVLLIVLGGGVMSQMGPSNIEHAGEKGGTNRVVPNAGLQSPVETDTSLRLTLLYYEVDALLRSLVAFDVLRDTLVRVEPHTSATVTHHPPLATTARHLSFTTDSAREPRPLSLDSGCRVRPSNATVSTCRGSVTRSSESSRPTALSSTSTPAAMASSTTTTPATAI